MNDLQQTLVLHVLEEEQEGLSEEEIIDLVDQTSLVLNEEIFVNHEVIKKMVDGGLIYQSDYDQYDITLGGLATLYDQLNEEFLTEAILRKKVSVKDIIFSDNQMAGIAGARNGAYYDVAVRRWFGDRPIGHLLITKPENGRQWTVRFTLRTGFFFFKKRAQTEVWDVDNYTELRKKIVNLLNKVVKDNKYANVNPKPIGANMGDRIIGNSTDILKTFAAAGGAAWVVT